MARDELLTPPNVHQISDEMIKNWIARLKEVDPPTVTFSRDKLAMANEAVEQCMEVARVMRAELEAYIMPSSKEV